MCSEVVEDRRQKDPFNFVCRQKNRKEQQMGIQTVVPLVLGVPQNIKRRKLHQMRGLKAVLKNTGLVELSFLQSQQRLPCAKWEKQNVTLNTRMDLEEIMVGLTSEHPVGRLQILWPRKIRPLSNLSLGLFVDNFEPYQDLEKVSRVKYILHQRITWNY